MADWRPIDLRLPPLSLSPPLRVINEGCTLKGDLKEKLSLGDCSSHHHTPVAVSVLGVAGRDSGAFDRDTVHIGRGQPVVLS
jgi:hypothetical protein